MQGIGIYIHVPFCIKRCTYCAFYSTTQGKKERGAFVRALIQEMKARPSHRPISTLYFGGGTPSQLDTEELQEVFQALHVLYNIEEGAEITFEANPDDLTPELAALLVHLGVNRVSLGVQSFDDAMLRTLNRRHDAQQAQHAVELLHQAGIHNVSIDLIYGLPGQTYEAWEKDIQMALSLDIQHLSSYALSYEPGTVLYQKRKLGKVKEADEELSLRMFRTLIQRCDSAGLSQYEISNFARPNQESRHNSSYWKGTPYMGFGPSAHSYDGLRTRRHNIDSLARYTNRQEEDAPHELEVLSETELHNEMIMLSLRTRKGISLQVFRERFGNKAENDLRHAAQPYIDKAWLAQENDRLEFTSEGIFVSDYVMTDLMRDDD